jgi:hypothetical protein
VFSYVVELILYQISIRSRKSGDNGLIGVITISHEKNLIIQHEQYICKYPLNTKEILEIFDFYSA